MYLKSFHNLKYNGFTLAEVLITLVIIGIIAALTVPTIIQNSNESATVSKVKKTMSILGQAKILAESANGPIQDWDFGEGYTEETATQFWRYIRPYLQVAQDCGSATNCYQSNGIYRLNGNLFDKNYNTNTAFYKFVLSDGSVMWLRTAQNGKCSATDGNVKNACAVCYIDVNGEKAPNTVGRDIFLYVINPDGVFPYLYDDCAKNSTGWGCSSYILKKNNMNYLH